MGPVALRDFADRCPEDGNPLGEAELACIAEGKALFCSRPTGLGASMVWVKLDPWDPGQNQDPVGKENPGFAGEELVHMVKLIVFFRFPRRRSSCDTRGLELGSTQMLGAAVIAPVEESVASPVVETFLNLAVKPQAGLESPGSAGWL